jgi:Ca2+-binding RTX toxin-like protein
LISVDAPVPAAVQLVAAQDWQRGYVACNVGSPASRGTGQTIPLEGLGRYSAVVQGDPRATVTLALDATRDSALFLDDAYSSFHGSLQAGLQANADGLRSQARLSNIERIIMGGGGGLSIVDLTSSNYHCSAITVLGGGVGAGRSVFWGSDGNDNFEARGADAIVFGGAGANTYSLSTGRETLQYVFGGQARDRIIAGALDQQGGAHRFDPALDTIELWTDAGAPAQEVSPSLSSQGDGTLLSWGGNQLLFEGQTFGLEMLTLVPRTIDAAGPFPLA